MKIKLTYLDNTTEMIEGTRTTYINGVLVITRKDGKKHWPISSLRSWEEFNVHSD